MKNTLLIFCFLGFFVASCDNTIEPSSFIELSKNDLIGSWNNAVMKVMANDTIKHIINRRVFSDSFYYNYFDIYTYVNTNLIASVIAIPLPLEYIISNDTIYTFSSLLGEQDSANLFADFTIVKDIDSTSITIQDNESTAPIVFLKELPLI